MRLAAKIEMILNPRKYLIEKESNGHNVVEKM